MINHVRTLLLNQPPNGNYLSAIGEELIPADFNVRQLTPPIERAWKAIFGSRPDYLFRAVRAVQLLQLIHASPLERFVTVKDPRLTYSPLHPPIFKNTFKIDVQSDDDITGVQVRNNEVVNESTGQCVWEWHVGIGSTNVTAKLLQTGETQTVSRQQELTLPGSNSKIYIPAAIANGVSLTNPIREATGLAAILTAATKSGLMPEIFDAAKNPFASQLKPFADDYPTPTRWAAILLAMAYRIEELPVAL